MWYKAGTVYGGLNLYNSQGVGHYLNGYHHWRVKKTVYDGISMCGTLYLNSCSFYAFVLASSRHDVLHSKLKNTNLKYFKRTLVYDVNSEFVMSTLQYKNTGTKENEELFEEDVDAARPVRNTDVETLIQITEQELRPELGTLSEDEDDDVDDWEEYESDEDAHANALFHLEFRQHKKDYYMTKLEYVTVDRCAASNCIYSV